MVKFLERNPHYFLDKKQIRKAMGGRWKLIEIVRAENLSSQLEGDQKKNFSQKLQTCLNKKLPPCQLW